MTTTTIATILFSPYNYDQAKGWILGRQAQFHGIIIGYVALIMLTAKLPLAAGPSLSLRTPLALWNALLAVFSLVGFLKVSPMLISSIHEKGIVYTYSQIGELQTDPIAGYWTLLWVLSKVPELFDTIFIIARGRPLRFMHWFHHAMSILFGTINFAGDNAYLVWVVWMNFLIHAIMYSYYLLASLGIRLSRPLAQTITTMQMIQFLVIICQLAHIAFLQLIAGVQCAISPGGFSIGMFTTLVYMKLWANFYREQYLKK